MRTYLVQEGQFSREGEIEGMDSIIDWKYMGAAEFEFGALPESLKRIAKDLDEYTVFQTRYFSANHERLYYFCKKEQLEDVREVIKALRKNSSCGILKRGIFFRLAFTKNVPWNFWWDVENDFFFFFGEEHAIEIRQAMTNLRERWKEELFPVEKKKSFLQKLFNF